MNRLEALPPIPALDTYATVACPTCSEELVICLQWQDGRTSVEVVTQTIDQATATPLDHRTDYPTFEAYVDHVCTLAVHHHRCPREN